MKRKPKRDPMPPELREEVLRRDGYGCQARGIAPGRCSYGLEVHHLLARGRGGRHELDNLMALCPHHHHWVTDHPAEAAELGLNRRGYGKPPGFTGTPPG